MNDDFYKLILVTHRQHSSLTQYLDFIQQCVSSGVTCVQFRDKNSDKSFKLQFAYQLKEVLISYNVPLIINDDLNLAVKIKAEGVHLGQSDIPPQTARELLGKDKYIGLSIETKAQLAQANLLNLNYTAASAVFPSAHKNNLQTIWGLDGLKNLSQRTSHPIIGIGGINEHNAAQVIQSGAKGIAVIGALHLAENPAAIAAKLRHIIDRELQHDH